MIQCKRTGLYLNITFKLRSPKIDNILGEAFLHNIIDIKYIYL